MQLQPRYKKGDKIGGRYLVHQALMGGMGEVYLCLDLEQNYPYALKTFQSRYLTKWKLHEAFDREVATWVALEKHPNIVRCFFMETLDNQPFMFLEWVASEEGRGADLQSWLRRRPLDLRVTLDFAIDICRGLIHADQKQPGIVHRDLKPHNILIAQERIAKITDFGLAKVAQKAAQQIWDEESIPSQRRGTLGVSGFVGTPPYMAPEQWRIEELDARTDIYAVGCILYEMLIGRCPFVAINQNDLRRQHLEAAIPKLPISDTLPAAMGTLISRCLAKQKEERFATVTDLLQELSHIYQQQFSESPNVIASSTGFTAADYNNRGVTYFRMQRFDEALADFNEAIQLNPNFVYAYTNRGGTYSSLERYDEALADYTNAIRSDPRFAPVYTARGVTYERMQRYEEALVDHGTAIELDNTYAQAYYNRGVINERLQRYDKALMDYTYAIEFDPRLAQAYLNIGVVYGNRGALREALPYFEKAAQLGNAQGAQYAAQIRQMLNK
jgi:serine/threonine protein kinase